MRTKSKSNRNYTQNKKKKKIQEAGTCVEDPTPCKQDASYSFIVNNERFPFWIKSSVLRYWEDFKDSFDVHWNDAVDNENAYVEHSIKVSEKPQNDKQDSVTYRPSVNRAMYTITVYRTNNKFQVLGNYRQHWVRKEFPMLQQVIDDFLNDSEEARSIVKSYNKIFESNLDMDILEDPDIKDYFIVESRDPAPTKTPPTAEKVDAIPNVREKPIIEQIDLTAELPLPQEKQIINLTVDTKDIMSDLEKDFQNLPDMTSNRELKQLIKDTISPIVVDLTNRVKELENRNDQLSKQIIELSNLVNPGKLKEDIKEIAEQVMLQNINEHAKEIRKNMYRKINQLTKEKIQEINIERDAINTQFEDYKIKIKSDTALEKMLIDQKIDALTSDMKKVYNDMDQLQRANNVKTDKLKNLEETNKQLLETLHKYEEQLQEKLEVFKQEHLNEETIEKSVIAFMEQQSPKLPITTDENDIDLQSSRNAKDNPATTQKQINSNIIVLMDSNRKFIDKNKLFPNEKALILACPTIERGREILQRTKFVDQHTIIIHTGVNDLENCSPQEVSNKFCELLLSYKTTYPTVKIIASSITPRKDQLNTAVKRANELIHNELKKDEMKDIILIDNSNLDKQELLLDAKHLNRKNGVKILASNIKRTQSLQAGIKFNHTENQQSRIKPNVKVDNRNTSTNTNSKPDNIISTSTVMTEVLQQLKQMNTYLINQTQYPKPRLLPPPGPWLNNPFPHQPYSFA